MKWKMKKRKWINWKGLLLLGVLWGALNSCTPSAPAPDSESDTSVPVETTAPAPETVGGQFGFKQAFSWEYDPSSQTLTVSGEGVLPDLTPGKQKWADYSGEIQTVILAEGITEIGKYGFGGMPALRTVSFPASLTTVGMGAFSDCTALEECTIPGTVSRVENRAFQRCTALKKITFEEGVAFLGSQLLAECTALESVYVPSTAGIDRTHVNYTADGCLFYGITDFSALTVHVQTGSDAYAYFTTDIYTITNHTNSDQTAKYPLAPNYMKEGRYNVNVLMHGDPVISYDRAKQSAVILSPAEQTADLTFTVTDAVTGELLTEETIKGVSLKYGETRVSATTIPKRSGLTVKIALTESGSTKLLCPELQAAQKIQIFMAGDSIMRAYTLEGDYPQQGWGVPFADHFDADAVEVFNMAAGGATAESFYKLNRAASGENAAAGYGQIKRLMQEGDYLILGFLHNDNLHSNMETYRKYMQKYVEEARAAGVTPIIVVQPPRGTAQNEHGEYPKAIPELAKTLNVFCVDTDTPLRAELTKDLTAAQNSYWLFRLVERGVITQTQLNNHVNQTLKKNGKDPTHISEGGAAWVARYVASAMKDAGVLAEYITLE